MLHFYIIYVCCFYRPVVNIPGQVTEFEKTDFQNLIRDCSPLIQLPTPGLLNLAVSPIDNIPSAVLGTTHIARFSVIATQSIVNVDDDQPIRYLDVVMEEPIEIDERLTLGRSLFGDKTAEILAKIRGMKMISGAMFICGNVATLIGYVILYLEMFSVKTQSTNYLRWIFACLFPMALFQGLSSIFRLITKMVLRILVSFDAMYLSSQAFLFTLVWCYIYHNDVVLILLVMLISTGTISNIFSDAMSEKSRQRVGGIFMIFLIVLIIFCIIVWKLSPESPFHDSVELPGGKWLINLGYHPIIINPIDFCTERVVTIIIFFSRFLYKHYKYPNAALNLNLPYVRRAA